MQDKTGQPERFNCKSGGVSTEQWGAKYQLDESYTTKGAGKCGGFLELKGCGDNRGQSVGVAIRDAIEKVC
jgi:hypothetical protein